MTTSRSSCPCCEGSGSAPIERIAYGDIWRGLEEKLEITVSANVKIWNTPASTTTLVECQECGLQYFCPMCPGDPEFYLELASSPEYYYDTRWEFARVRSRLARPMAVLDVGCGAGAFLGAIRSVVARASGWEPNCQVASQARGRGLDVETGDLEAFAARNPRAFDAVCAFQVVEHLARVQPFLKTVLSCLRPGGCLFVSVPNRRRVIREAQEPLDCPPHHVSRWSAEQLGRLAHLLNLEVLSISYEPATALDVRYHLRSSVAERAQRHPLASLGDWLTRGAARVAFSERLHQMYQRFGWAERWGFVRMSMLAELRRGAEPGVGRAS